MASPPPPRAAGAPPALARRLWRTGLAVVGGSVFASTAFTHLAFAWLGDVDYTGTMIAAVLIPLVVASCAYGWIAALTLQLEASRSALDRLAHEDPLTGLANRRAALARVDAWARTGGNGPVVLAIADIDFFKRINDRLGHDGGDASLVHFAAMLGRLVPADWLVARIGGEEFLIAARRTPFAAFTDRIESLRAAIADTPLITSSGPWSLTASFGLAEQHPGEPAERLITRADRALYAAKQGGRNRTEQAA